YNSYTAARKPVMPPDRIRAYRERVGGRVFHDRRWIERGVVGAVLRVHLEDIRVDVRMRPTLLRVVRVDLGLVPRNLSLRRRILMLMDHAERMTEFVTHHSLVLTKRRRRFEPSVV